MMIKVENLQVIERAVKQRVGKMATEFESAVTVEKNRIQERTQSGLDVNGANFRPYMPYTIENRRRFNKQTAKVDLTFNGDMFKAFKVLFTKAESTVTGVLTFGVESWKVRKNQDLYGRRFFGFSNEQIEIIKNKLRNVK